MGCAVSLTSRQGHVAKVHPDDAVNTASVANPVPKQRSSATASIQHPQPTRSLTPQPRQSSRKAVAGPESRSLELPQRQHHHQPQGSMLFRSTRAIDSLGQSLTVSLSRDCDLLTVELTTSPEDPDLQEDPPTPDTWWWQLLARRSRSR